MDRRYFLDTPWVRFSAGGALILGIVLGGNHFLTDEQSPEEIITSSFTGEGKCLNDTPYDLDRGALLAEYSIKGNTFLSLMPRDANTRKPSVLFFVEQETSDGETELGFADFATAEYLVEHDCIDETTGM